VRVTVRNWRKATALETIVEADDEDDAERLALQKFIDSADEWETEEVDQAAVDRFYAT
jgi:hypothetical protein